MSTRPRQAILLVTVLLGVLSAVAVVLGTSASERTFAVFCGPVHSSMSVTVPFLGVLLVSELKRPAGRSTIGPALLAALVVAVLVALFGTTLCATFTAVVPSAAIGRWQGAATVVVGSVLVQCTAQFVGTGLGLVLWRRPVVACLATVVLPLALWLLLGLSEALRPAQQWLTPYASAQNLLSGHMAAVDWARWLVTASVWGLALNTIGVHRAVTDG